MFVDSLVTFLHLPVSLSKFSLVYHDSVKHPNQSDFGINKWLHFKKFMSFFFEYSKLKYVFLLYWENVAVVKDILKFWAVMKKCALAQIFLFKSFYNYKINLESISKLHFYQDVWQLQLLGHIVVSEQVSILKLLHIFWKI